MKPSRSQVRRVVRTRRGSVAAYSRAGSRARLGVGLDHDGDLGARRARPARPRSRAKRVCSTGVKYGCVPSERSAASSSIFGPSAAAIRSSRGTGSRRRVEPVEERPHRRQRLAVVARRLRVPDADAEQEAAREARAASSACCAATSAGSCCQTLRMPVATVIACSSPRGTARIGYAPGCRRSRASRTPAPRAPRTASVPCRLARQMPIVPSSMRHRMPRTGAAQSR